MHTKKVLCSILFLTSPLIMAEPIYQSTSPNTSQHEVTNGSVGLVAGSLIAGPLGAIIGGSIGVLTGHQQTQSKTITEQQKFIADLELDLAVINTELSQSKLKISQLESTQLQVENTLQQYNETVKNVASGYQFDLYFLSNSDTIQSHAQQGLVKLAILLKNNPTITARIEAHSDWRGSNDENFQLAQKRLDSVAHYLSLQGTDNAQLQTTNYGENQNMNHGSWGDELFYDRRVTITLICFSR
jgi:outer membrane protein OmpA-like peptidoglycan-associated protein